MSDLEKLIALFTEFGLTQGTGTADFQVTTDATGTVVRLNEGVGYSDFHAEFFFAPDGKFVKHGVWE